MRGKGTKRGKGSKLGEGGLLGFQDLCICSGLLRVSGLLHSGLLLTGKLRSALAYLGEGKYLWHRPLTLKKLRKIKNSALRFETSYFVYADPRPVL